MVSLRHVTSVLAAAAVLALAGGARADVPLLKDNYYEVGAAYSLGGYAFPLSHGDLGATGVRIYERNGFFGKALWTIFIGAAMALGQSNEVYLGSEYGPGYQIDYYREKTYEERAADEAARDQAMDAASSNEYQTDIQIFWPKDGLGQAKGYILSSYPFSFNLGSTSLDIGFQVARVEGPCRRDGAASDTTCHYSNFGMPLKWSIPLWSVAMLDFEADLNFLALGDDDERTVHSHPLKAELTLHPWERIFVRGGVSLPGFSTDDLGLHLEAGIRF
ncbi:MAG: hypothetical protein U1F43_11100 [Myxococcota bacterium]